MMQKQTSTRNTSFELLRVIAMVMVVSCHTVPKFIEYCGYDINNTPVLLSNTLLSWYGGVGVMIFIAISAWFLVDKEFNIKRMLKIFIEVFLIRILFLLGECAYLTYSQGIINTAKKVFFYEISEILTPLWSDDWYITVYLILLLIMPYLNFLLHKFSKTQIRNGLIVFSFILVMLNFESAGLVRGGMVYIPWFYCLVGYLKLYQPDNFFSRKPVLKLLVVIPMFLISKFLLPKITGHGILGTIALFLPTTIANDRGFSFMVGIMSLLIFYAVKDFYAHRERERRDFTSYSLLGKDHVCCIFDTFKNPENAN